jgi:glycosyltransferase involved in cell wall biosynthesis
LKIAIIIERIPPFCGGAEQVAWVHAVELAKHHEVHVLTYGDVSGHSVQDNVQVHFLPCFRHNLAAYATTHRSVLNQCIDRIDPSIIHSHMPNELSACVSKKHRLMVSTIHDGVPENELFKLKEKSLLDWVKFKMIRRINIKKSDAVTCVSQHNLDVMKSLYVQYAERFSFIPNPIHERFFKPTSSSDSNIVLNFGRQIPLKMAALLDVARQMPELRFVFVGTGEMVGDYGLENVHFEGFSAVVEEHIDASALCVFPSLSENFPLVGLEAMARAKTVIATRRGFSEYIEHMENGYLLDSADPSEIKEAIQLFTNDHKLRVAVERKARETAEKFSPPNIVDQYVQLYTVMVENQRKRNDYR